MSPKKNEYRAFTSFRIIGEKAQKLLSRAREIRKANATNDGTPSMNVSDQEPLPEVMVRLAIPSVVKSALAILAIAFGVLLAYLILETIVLLLLAMFLAAVIDPGVKAMGRIGIPRGFAILIQYFLFLSLLLFLLLSLIPIIAIQVADLARLLSEEVNSFLASPSIHLPLVPEEVNDTLTSFVEATLRDLSINRFTDALQQFGQSLSSATQGILALATSLAGSVVGFIVGLILVLVLAFFLQMEKERIFQWVRGFLPSRYRGYLDDKSEAIYWKLGQWARGQLILCCVVGLLVFIALLILRMPYALTLAILAGFTEFVPVLGPWIAAIPAILIGGTQEGFFWALIIAAVYYVIQWCENNLLVPLIMKRAVGLPATSIMLAMLIGVSFPSVIHPVLGIMLSIPATTIIAIFLEDWRDWQKRQRDTSRGA